MCHSHCVSRERERDGEVEAQLVEGERQLAEAERAGEPPVVARLVVEVRSDGSRTIARGALEDLELGQTTAVEARGDSPMQLAWSLAKMIAAAPALARHTARAMLPGGRRRPRRGRLRRWLRGEKR